MKNEKFFKTPHKLEDVRLEKNFPKRTLVNARMHDRALL